MRQNEGYKCSPGLSQTQDPFEYISYITVSLVIRHALLMEVFFYLEVNTCRYCNCNDILKTLSVSIPEQTNHDPFVASNQTYSL